MSSQIELIIRQRSVKLWLTDFVSFGAALVVLDSAGGILHDSVIRTSIEAVRIRVRVKNIWREILSGSLGGVSLYYTQTVNFPAQSTPKSALILLCIWVPSQDEIPHLVNPVNASRSRIVEVFKDG
jgi:hypothetical protein